MYRIDKMDKMKKASAALLDPDLDVAGLISRAREAARSRSWTEALRQWNDVAERAPEEASACCGAAHALRELGRYSDAESTLEAGARRLPENEQIAIARAWLANARRDWPEALARWESCRSRFPNNPWGYLGNAQALNTMGRAKELGPLLASAERLATAKRITLGELTFHRIELEIAKLRLDWTAVRAAAEEILKRETEPPAQALLTLAQAFWHLGSPDEADATALRALAVDPALADAVLVRAWVATGRGDGETAMSCYRRMVELKPDAVRWALKLVQLLNWHGRVQEAVSELETISQRWPNDPLVRTFLRNYGPAATVAVAPTGATGGNLDHAEEAELEALVHKAPGPTDYVRPLLDADPARDVLIAESAGAETAVLIFTGSNDALSMPIPVFDRYLAAIPVTAVYLKDFNRLRFLRGIKSLNKDYEGTLSALKKMLRRLGTKRLITLGNCDGGFAAIRYGVELGAQRVVTFGAPTYSPGNALSRIEQARNFMKNRLAASVPSDLMDLRPFLETHPHTTQIDLFYEAEDARDSSQALHLAGLPGVQHHPRPGLSDHHLLRALALVSQDFRSLLEELLGVAPSVATHLSPP